MAKVPERPPGVPADRIMPDPPPGTARAADIPLVRRDTGWLCELVDGTLVRRAGGAYESVMASALIAAVGEWNARGGRRRGWAFGPAGYFRLAPGRVRSGAVSFVARGQVPGDRLPPGAEWLETAPRFTAEIVHESHTPEELLDRRRDFFEAGTGLVWQVDPAAGTCEVFTGAERPTETVPADGTLNGRDVLPGLSVPLANVLGAVKLN